MSDVTCLTCSRPLTGRQTRYCLTECKERNPDRLRRPTRTCRRTCGECGTVFRLPGNNRRRTCDECRAERLIGPLSCVIPWATCDHCSAPYVARHGRRRYCTTRCYWLARGVTPEGETRCRACRCGALSEPMRRRGPWSCDDCKVEAIRRYRRSRPPDSHRARARRAGVRYEPISPRSIYERDRWRCGICGERVDRSLEYPHAMSASLDHIVPIARGGDHVRANVQCAHFMCNSVKSDHAAGDQLRLLG